MKKILLTGVSPEVTEEKVAEALSRFGPVAKVTIVRDGDSENPVVVVEMALTDRQAYDLTTRITDIWHDGRHVDARLLLH